MPLPEATAFGLPLLYGGDVVHPIAVVVGLKGLDSDGEIAYWSATSDGLTVTEAMGMTLGLLDDLRDTRRGLCGDDGDSG